MKIVNMLLYLMGVFSTMYIVRIGGIPVSTLLAVICIIAIIICRGKVALLGDKCFFAFLCASTLTTILMLLSDTTNFKTQIITLGVMGILYFCITQMKLLPDSSIKIFFSGLRLSCILHLAWCLIQFFAYQLFDMDVNRMIFVDALNMVSNASRYREGTLAITGFCWHPSNLIPVLLISGILLNRWYIWVICFFIVIYAHSGTALLGLMIAFILVLPLHIPQVVARIKKIKISTVFLFFMAVSVVIVVLVKTDLFSIMIEKYRELYERVFSTGDMSAQVHMRYYVMLPFVWLNSSILEILFGCGLGCSGVLFSRYFNQYTQLDAWIVESDPMNYMYSVGIVGFLLFYTWIFQLFRSAKGKNKRYSLLLVCLIICGITYNVQYEWVIMIELAMAICLKRDIDIFQSDSLLWQEKKPKRKIKLC